MNLSESTRRRNPALAGTDVITPADMQYLRPDGTWEIEEPFQRSAERLLESLGFARSTQAAHMANAGERGWFGHIPQHRTREMFILLDLPVWHRDGRWCQIELKTVTGRPNPHQRAMLLNSPHCYCCRTLDAVRDALHAEGMLDTYADAQNYPRKYRELLDELTELYLMEGQTDGVRYDLHAIMEQVGDVPDDVREHYEERYGK